MLYEEITLVSIMIRLLEAFAQVFLLSSILKVKINKREYIISSILIVALYEIASLVIPTNYKFIIIFAITVPVVSIICKITVYKVFLAYSLACLIIALLDMINVVILFYTLGVDTFQEISSFTEYYYLGMIMVNVLIFMSGLIIRYIKMAYISGKSNRKNVGIAFNTILTLLFIFPSLVIIIAYIENRPLTIKNIVISLVSMAAILLISIINSQKQYRLIESERELEYQKNYNVILQSLVDGLRTFKHDYNNTLATLYGYVQLNDTKSLKRMFKEILEESKQISSLDKLNPNLIKDPNIFGILIAKYQECIKRNIAMEFEIFAELENLEIKTYDLTRIIGIFLDNAIEAAGGSTEKKINLLINEDKATVTIEISNTYSNKEISIEHMFEKGVSSKGENRGLGLYKVKEILKRCTGAELKTTKDDNVFLQKLIIQKSKNISVANQ